MHQARREELAREANACTEQAALLHLDGHQEHALESADRGIRAVEALYRADRTDAETVAMLAACLRTRAEIRSTLGSEQYRSGIRDATRAIELYSTSDWTDPDRHPLLLPGLRLQLGELRCGVRDLRRARQDADQALAGYREHLQPGAEDSELTTAHALYRYGCICVECNDGVAATAAWREAVGRYRPHTGHRGRLWRDHSTGTLWVGTPTLERFSWAAYQLAMAVLPPSERAAPEASLALQDAAEASAALLPPIPISSGAVGGRMAMVVGTLGWQVEWLTALGEADLAARYDALQRELSSGRPEWHPAVAALRPPLLAALTTRGRV